MGSWVTMGSWLSILILYASKKEEEGILMESNINLIFANWVFLATVAPVAPLDDKLREL